jgi:hypothetical protein
LFFHFSRGLTVPKTKRQKLQTALKQQRLLNQEILMYRSVMEGMRKGLKLEALLKIIIRSVCEGLGFRRAGIFLVEPDGKSVRLALGIDKNGNFEKNKDLIPLYPQKVASHFSDVIQGYKKYFYSNNIPKRMRKKDRFRVQVFNNALVPLQLGAGQAIGPWRSTTWTRTAPSPWRTFPACSITRPKWGWPSGPSGPTKKSATFP